MRGLEMCMLCHFNEHSSEMRNLEALKAMLQRKRLDTRKIKQYRHFYWGAASERCRFGVSCHKTQQYHSRFNSLTSDLNGLLSAYLEQTDEETKKKEKHEQAKGGCGMFECGTETPHDA